MDGDGLLFRMGRVVIMMVLMVMAVLAMALVVVRMEVLMVQ